VDLLNTDSSSIDASDIDLVEDRQYGGAGSYPEGGRPQGKGSPRGGREDTPSRPPAPSSSPACLHPFGGEPPGRRSIEVPVDPGLAPLPQGVSPDVSPQGPSPDRTPITLLKRVIRKLERSRGMFLLVTPYWDAQTWFASLQALRVEDVRRLPFSDDLIINLTTGEPPPNLERLFLVVWTILGGIGESTPSRTGPSVSSRQDGSDPQKTATKERGSLSRPSSTLPPFLSIMRL
jgi:hypothetical protein